MIERFQAAGWTTDACDGHDAADVFRALTAAQNSDAPVLIACRTIIGFGMPNRQGTQKAHCDAPGEAEVAAARKVLGWDYAALRGARRSSAISGARSANAAKARSRTGPGGRQASSRAGEFDAAHGGRNSGGAGARACSS